MGRTRKTLVSAVEFTDDMNKTIERYKQKNLLTREQVCEKIGISGLPTLHHWRRRSGKISFTTIMKMKKIGIDLLPFVKFNEL